MIYDQITKLNYNLTFRNASKPMAILNKDGTVVRLNDSFREFFKMECLGRIQDLSKDNKLDMWSEYTRLAEKNKEIDFDMYLHVDFPGVKNMKVIITYCDITSHFVAYFKEIEKWQEEPKNIYSNAFHSAGILMIITDRNYVIRDINNLSRRFFDLSPNLFIGKKMTEFIKLFSSTSERFQKYMELAFVDGSTSALMRYEKEEGEFRYYFYSTEYDEEMSMYITRVMDRTHEVTLENKLAHSKSLSSIGELAASIAHEIRNPLTTLKGFTQLMKISAEGETIRYLNVIDDEINRMESILNEMLVLSKPSKNEKKVISLQKLLKDMAKIISPKASLEGIEIKWSDKKITQDIILGDEIKLKQAVLNIMKNSMEAMSPSGTLTLRVRNINDNQVIATIEDTGSGISVKHLKQIFNPHFTTRADGNGFGLPFVYNTIKDHGGGVDVESNLGKGTKFTLIFPTVVQEIGNGIVDEKELALLGFMA